MLISSEAQLLLYIWVAHLCVQRLHFISSGRTLESKTERLLQVSFVRYTILSFSGGALDNTLGIENHFQRAA